MTLAIAVNVCKKIDMKDQQQTLSVRISDALRRRLESARELLGRANADSMSISEVAKRFLEDPETGVTVRLVKYPAGFTNIWHTHPCAHGMFVLEGTLVTHEGSFGPGSFVWFPEGMKMEHGAMQDNDVTVLFLTNKKFEIHYQQP